MMPSRPRLVLSLLVALAITLGALLLVEPRGTRDGLTHPAAQPGAQQNLQ